MANKSGRRKEFRRRDITDEMITRDTFHLILTQESLVKICNFISSITGKKMTLGSVDALNKFIARLPANKYYQKRCEEVQKQIAADFVNRWAASLGTIQEENFDTHISGVDQDTDVGTITDYNKKEIMQFTPDENQFKFSAHADRRGNAVIDNERVAGLRSSPDNILPLSAEKNQGLVNQELYKSSLLIQNFLAAESIEDMFSRIQSINTNYYNINLPFQILQFDSRNRLPMNAGSSEYRWNVHHSGQTGQLGNIRVLDTVQQIIRVEAFPFWAPVNATTNNNPYLKIRMLIHELMSQSPIASEWNDPDQSIPTDEIYTFEFDVTDQVADRIFLVPKQTTFELRKPLSQLFSLTTTFRTPFEEEVFDPDNGIFTVTYGLPTLFTITTPAVHLLNTGDLVYVYNVDSGNTTIDNLINRRQGYFITVLSTTQFTIPVDSSAIVGSDVGIHVYYGSKRLFFQLKFTSLEQ
jgi:hypothetical protein